MGLGGQAVLAATGNDKVAGSQKGAGPELGGRDTQLYSLGCAARGYLREWRSFFILLIRRSFVPAVPFSH